MSKRARRRAAWMAAVWGAAFGLGFGCSSDGGSQQVLTGRVGVERGTPTAIAVRAVVGEQVITAGEVRRDGSFRIALPSGARYRLEVLTTTGVKHVLERGEGGWKGLEVAVCEASAPFDLGALGKSSEMCNPSDPSCGPTMGEPCKDPMDPNCPPPPPPSCGGANEPPCPPPCDPMTDPACGCTAMGCPPPPPCGGPNEPACPDPGTCNPMDPSDPDCMGGGTNECDPMDPEGCKDPCVTDPMTCGCMPSDPNCWPPPEPPNCMGGTTPNTMCDATQALTPTNVPGDFGCKGSIAK